MQHKERSSAGIRVSLMFITFRFKIQITGLYEYLKLRNFECYICLKNEYLHLFYLFLATLKFLYVRRSLHRGKLGLLPKMKERKKGELMVQLIGSLWCSLCINCNWIT